MSHVHVPSTTEFSKKIKWVQIMIIVQITVFIIFYIVQTIVLRKQLLNKSTKITDFLLLQEQNKKKKRRGNNHTPSSSSIDNSNNNESNDSIGNVFVVQSSIFYTGHAKPFELIWQADESGIKRTLCTNISLTTLNQVSSQDRQLTGSLLRDELSQEEITLLNAKVTIPNPDTIINEQQQEKWKQLPKSFDLRNVYVGNISAPLNQGDCGSCWAFATAASATDRVRIVDPDHLQNILLLTDQVKNNKDNTQQVLIKNSLDPYLLAACDFCGLVDPSQKHLIKFIVEKKLCNNLCKGGIIEFAYIFLFENGLISMGCNIESRFAYTCHDVKNITQFTIPEFRFEECHNHKFLKPYRVNLYLTKILKEHTTTKEQFHNNEQAICYDIYTNGTVTTNMQVYESFYNFFNQYPTGVYDLMNHDKDTFLSGHAVSLIGWGETDQGVKYWVVRNTWGTFWGDQGCFRILRGQNCCHIEGDVWGIHPDAEQLHQVKKVQGWKYSKNELPPPSRF